MVQWLGLCGLLPRAKIRSLVKELRSLKLRCVAFKNNNKKPLAKGIYL